MTDITVSDYTKARRKEQLSLMHNFVLNLNDEDYYMWWIMVVPDDATDDDLDYIASDTRFYEEVCDLFKRVITQYHEQYGVLD